MILRGIPFNHVWQASGATNFYGQGWWYHKPLKPFGLNFKGTTFVSKTTTLFHRAGNMKLKADGVTPKEWFPKCIHANRRTGAAVNAVGLSGPGLDFLLNSGGWQSLTEPFCISIMSLDRTSKGRLREIRNFSMAEIVLITIEKIKSPLVDVLMFLTHQLQSRYWWSYSKKKTSWKSLRGSLQSLVKSSTA